MLDLRPMVFLNILAFLLLATAGFARLVDNTPIYDHQPISTVDVLTIKESQPDKVTITEETVPPASTLQDFESVDDQLETTFEQAVLFVDELSTAEQQQFENRTEPVTAKEVLVATLGETLSATELTARKAAQESTPAPKPVPVMQPPAAPELPETGALSVRSNVANDQVFVNGKLRGSSGKSLTLPAGEYEIVVSKEGYKPWRSVMDLARGDNRTLVVTLERITRVDYHNGTWQHGVVTGSGTYVEEDGTRYEGEFVDKKFHGKGRLIGANNLTYEGEWFAGNKHGVGTLKRPDGSTYTGEFRDDQFNGQGTLTEVSGTIRSGHWVNGELNGEGSLTDREGTLYSGAFVDGKFHGNGSITYADGTYYEGSFANGQYQGKGDLTFPDGKKYSGNFLESQFHGQGDLMNPNGSKITGSFKFGKPFGVVTLTTAEGEVFTARSDNPGVCYRLKSYRATECPVLEGW